MYASSSCGTMPALEHKFFLFCLSLVPLILPMSMLVALAMSAPKLAVSNTP